MSATRIVPGQIVPLKVTLEENDSGRFIQAIVTDNANNVIAGPLTLTHIAGGEYRRNDYPMPNLPFISVRYEIDAEFFNTEDTFVREDGSGGGGGGGTIAVDEVRVEVQSENPVVIEVEENENNVTIDVSCDD